QGIGLILGSFLMYCIIFETRADVGYFKYLQVYTKSYKSIYNCIFFQLIFVTNDLLCSLAAFVLQEIQEIITQDYKFCLTILGADSLFCVCLYITSYCSIILIVAVNFIYRLWARDGYLNSRPACGVAIITSTIGSVLGLVLYSSFSIFFYLRQSKVISVQTRQLQFALFRTLAIQAVIPILLVHGCSSTQLIVPLFGVDIKLYSDVSTTIFSFLTPLDSLAVILLIGDYRRATISILKC
ncbi:hypothetical protein PENTCL1PPCAC_17100, partial [Pristionchus entomophagus]